MADAGERQYLELPVHPGAAAQARRHVRATLARWRMDGLAETAQLVVSELVTNAVKACRDARLAAARGDVLDDATPRGTRRDAGDGPISGGDGARPRDLCATGAMNDIADADDLGEAAATSRAGFFRRCVGLHVYRSGSMVIVEVWDPSRTPPTLKNASLDEEGGRGLMLVDVLAEKWGYRWPVPGGKVVWCALAADADLAWASGPAAGEDGEHDAEHGDREKEGVGAFEARHELVDGDRRQP